MARCEVTVHSQAGTAVAGSLNASGSIESWLGAFLARDFSRDMRILVADRSCRQHLARFAPILPVVCRFVSAWAAGKRVGVLLPHRGEV